jgi:hypothetical protein
MHGHRIIKICNAKQTKLIYQYNNIKIKLCKNNEAIWYNKTCRIKQLIPIYTNIRVRPRGRWEDNIKIDLQEVGGVVRTGWSWLRIGTDGGHLWVR